MSNKSAIQLNKNCWLRYYLGVVLYKKKKLNFKRVSTQMQDDGIHTTVIRVWCRWRNDATRKVIDNSVIKKDTNERNCLQFLSPLVFSSSCPWPTNKQTLIERGWMDNYNINLSLLSIYTPTPILPSFSSSSARGNSMPPISCS